MADLHLYNLICDSINDYDLARGNQQKQEEILVIFQGRVRSIKSEIQRAGEDRFINLLIHSMNTRRDQDKVHTGLRTNWGSTVRYMWNAVFRPEKKVIIFRQRKAEKPAQNRKKVIKLPFVPQDQRPHPLAELDALLLKRA